MWWYPAALIGIVVIAEVLGLGGIPAQSVVVENILFMVLLIALIATAFRKYHRH